ncbi:hypothetical protein GCM10009416_17950 [Craurococcus roseus]|uniref:Uncharacterized protein n=1 Tax=Craurococcus roseus TaxID=77585 RepID=A0ABP3Q033_9PROT
MSESTRAAIRLCVQGLPPVTAAVLTAALAPVGAPAAIAFGAFVGLCAWAKALQRRSAFLSRPGRFIGS